MFRKKSKITPGLIYALDPNNVAGQDTSGILTVEAVRLLGRSGHDYVWEVKPIIDDSDCQTIKINEKYLVPVNSPVVRIPLDIPTINERDLRTLIDIIETYEDDNDERKKRLMTLYKKLEFYKSMREV